MISLRCSRIRALLFATVGGHASDAERLEIETHLDGCARCGGDQVVADALRRLKQWEPSPLSEVARERVKRKAFESRSLRGTAREPRRRRLSAILVAGFALAATIWGLSLRQPDSRIVDGDIRASIVQGRTLGDGARLSSVHGGHVVLGGPSVELAADTIATWHASDRTIAVERGSVTVDVDPRQGKPFRVATPRFTVEVLGTRFTVDLNGVHTERGKVRVLDADRRVLAVVTAGQAWNVPVAATPPEPLSPHAPEPAITASPVARQVSSAHPGESPLRLQNAMSQLAQARQALTRGDSDAARRLVAPLVAGRRRVAADAQSIEAESFLVEGRYDIAIERYLAVSRRFDGTAEAENALYAAAQLQSESGRRDEAVGTLTRYLERYPQGRFIREVHGRLDRLSASGPR